MTDPITTTEAAALIGVSVSRLKILIRDGRIPVRRIGGHNLIERDAAVAFRKVPRPPGNRTGRARTKREDGR